MRCYGLRAALLAAALCAALLAIASLWLGLVGAAVVSALIVALGWIIYFHSERTVLTALRARQVSEVERPELHRLVRELARSARLPMPRLFVSPAAQPNILTVGYGAAVGGGVLHRGAAAAALAGRVARRARARAGARRPDATSRSRRRRPGSRRSSPSCPLIALLLLHIAVPSGREYGADIDGALLTGDPLALASALRKIDAGAAALPLRRTARWPPPAT